MKMKKYIAVLAIFLVLMVSCLRKNEKSLENITDENSLAANDKEVQTEALFEMEKETEIPDLDPAEFANRAWLRYFGKIDPIDTISLQDLQGCSWHYSFIFLQFSEQEHYAIGTPWSGVEFGNYKLENNTITFTPPFTINRFDEQYQVEKLFYSNELFYEGTPVLVNNDESVLFYPHEVRRSEIGSIVKKNQVYCERIYEKTKIITNNILYALPSAESKNLFLNNYYGDKSTEAETRKLAKAFIENVTWYYVFVDFTGDEPGDGGGPYYYGWLPEEYLE